MVRTIKGLNPINGIHDQKIKLPEILAVHGIRKPPARVKFRENGVPYAMPRRTVFHDCIYGTSNKKDHLQKSIRTRPILLEW
jgi:hypothetical protein